MNPLRVLWVGKTDAGFPQDGVRHYLQRIRTLHPIECIEIKAAHHSGRSPEQGLRMEADALLKRLAPDEAVALLDERGRELTSRAFADWLGTHEGRPLAMVLGGAYGVHEEVRRRAQVTLSLSRLTFPHQLARVIVLEQLYRALTIRAGHAYHHD